MLVELAQISVEFEERVRIFTEGNRERLHSQEVLSDAMTRFRSCEANWEEVASSMKNREEKSKKVKALAKTIWMELIVLLGRLHAVIIESDLFASVVGTFSAGVSAADLEVYMTSGIARKYF